ncbi:MAG: hypothetical protein V5B33_07845 [Candidatus Accumulibacter sp. UW20]|jgi:hypothetical protein
MSKEMPRMMLMPNHSAMDPAMIHMVKGVENKGVFIRNEYNKILDYIKCPEKEEQDIIVREIQIVQSQGADWKQPNWDALLGGKGQRAAKAN